MKRIIVYVDGFNLYHSLKQKQKWLNLQDLIKQLLKGDDIEILIKYFTAYCTWNNDKKRKHKKLVKVYEDLGVEVILGKFKVKYPLCKNCKTKYETHEEKETDVNIALHLLNDAYQDKYDVAYVLSADSDLIPAMQLVKSLFAAKHVNVILPPFAKCHDMKLKFHSIEIKDSHINNAILPTPYITNATNIRLDAPTDWV